MARPRRVGCPWDKPTIIYGIGKVSTHGGCSVESDSLDPIGGGRTCGADFSGGAQGIDLEVERVVCTVKSTRHVVVTIEALEGCHDIVHKGETATSCLVQAGVVEHYLNGGHYLRD